MGDIEERPSAKKQSETVLSSEGHRGLINLKKIKKKMKGQHLPGKSLDLIYSFGDQSFQSLLVTDKIQ